MKVVVYIPQILTSEGSTFHLLIFESLLLLLLLLLLLSLLSISIFPIIIATVALKIIFRTSSFISPSLFSLLVVFLLFFFSF